MRHLHSLLILAGLALLPIQLCAQGLHVAARNATESVVLRWAPVGVSAWVQGNRFGYRVERFIIDPQKKGKPVPVRISPDTLKPWPLERFAASFPADHPYAPAVAQVLYGQALTVRMGTIDPGALSQADNDLRLRQSLALTFADLDAQVADALALRWVDRDVDPAGIYLYRVIALDPANRDTAVIAVNRRLGPDAAPVAPKPTAEELDRSVKLRWPLAAGAFTAYWVERSDDGARWQRLNEQPHIEMGSQGKPATEGIYTDTTAGYGRMHHYRLRGITAFGETSEPSAEVLAMGRDRTPPPNPVMKEVKDENGKLVVHWEQPEGAADLKGFRVEKAPTAQGRFTALHAGLLPRSARSFTDTSTFLLGENHYLVYAVDTAGNEAASLGGYGFLTDTIPPAMPTGLIGAIDTNGVVTLRWRLGREPDLFGYRVFMANATDHEFSNLSPEPFADTAWSDTITLRTLTGRISYRVVAVDRNFNHSPMSAILTLAKPDLIPPVAPVFSGYHVTDTAVVLQFVPSSSPDAARYTLFRRLQEGNDLRKIAEWPAAPGRTSFTDTTASGRAFYTYRLQVADSAGNTSTCPADLSVEVPRARMRTAIHGLAVRYDAERKGMLLNWDSPAREVKHYVIYRSRNGSAPATIGSADQRATSFTDQDLPGKGDYTYFLKALYADGGVSPVAKSAGVQVP